MRWATSALPACAPHAAAAPAAPGRCAAPHPADPAVELTHAEPVGAYAVRLIFSDGHDRGISPWALLHELSKVAAA